MYQKARVKKAAASLWFACGALAGLMSLTLSMASVPGRGQITDDTAIYQNLSEIRAAKVQDLNFDGDIERLTVMKGRFRENLPRVQAPMKRIVERSQKYRYTGASAGTGVAKRTGASKVVRQ